MSKRNIFLILVLSVLLNTGCSLVDPKQRVNTKEYLINDSLLENSDIHNTHTSVEASLSEFEMVEDIPNNMKYTKDETVINLQFPNMANNTSFRHDVLSSQKYFDDKQVKISIEAMPLNKFIHLIFSKILEVDFVLDKTVERNSQPVSVNIKNKISKKKFFDIVLNILTEFNVAINIEKNIFYVKASKTKFISTQGVYIGANLPKNVNDNSVVYLMKPYYYNNNLNGYSSFIKSYFLSKDATLSIDKMEKFIKIKARAKEIRKAIKFYDFVDKSSMHNKNIKLVKLEHMDVEDFVEEIEPILKSYGITVTKSLRESGVQLLAIKQVNSFLLISDNPSWTDTVLLWRSKLDTIKKKTTIEQGFFVYNPENRKASELVKIINSFNHSNSQSDSNGSDMGNTSSLVVLDEERNNIIIRSSQAKFLEIENMLRKLDTLPKQVLVEVTIAEVTLTDSLEFGLEWFLKNNSSDYGYSLNALGSGAAGVVGNVFSISGSFGAVFNMLAKKKYLKILSNPKLLVLNNHKADINIGNQVPVITSQASTPDLGGGATGTPSILQNITYLNTGITLSVTPTINSKGYLTLKIAQTISDAQTNNTSDISSPLIFNRALNTDVILKSGESVMLGGLITENKSKDDSKIPFLGDIPIIKKLFSTSSDAVFRTELVIFVKPTILTSHEDTRAVTNSVLKLMNFY